MIKQRSAALGRSSLVIFIFIMRFTTELSPSQLPATARRITTIVSWQKWQSRIDNLRAEQAMNPIWDWFLRERHGLELAFGDIRQYMRTTSRCPWPPRTPKEYRLYSFMAVAVQIYSRLSQRGKARFAGAILSALEKEFGLGPLAFEVKVAAHLMGRGFEVDFHDLESGGGFDFLACQGETRIEVECKHISADIGRQIHRRKVYTLGGVLRPLIERAMNENPGGLFARVTLPGRLTGNKQEQEELAERIGSVMVGECVEVDDEICTVSRQSFELETSPFSVVRGRNLSLDDVLEYLHSEFGIENTNVISVWRPGHAAVLGRVLINGGCVATRCNDCSWGLTGRYGCAFACRRSANSSHRQEMLAG